MIVCPRGVVLVKGAVRGDVIEWPTSAGHQLVCHVLQPRGARLWVRADEERRARERQGGAGAEGARKGDGEEGESVCSRTSLAIATLSRVSSHRRRFQWRHALETGGFGRTELVSLRYQGSFSSLFLGPSPVRLLTIS